MGPDLQSWVQERGRLAGACFSLCMVGEEAGAQACSSADIGRQQVKAVAWLCTYTHVRSAQHGNENPENTTGFECYHTGCPDRRASIAAQELRLRVAAYKCYNGNWWLIVG